MAVDDLAASMLRAFLAELVLCRDDMEEEDVDFWCLLYVEGGSRELARELMSYRNAKRRLKGSRAGNPENIVGVLLYNVSHTGIRARGNTVKWRAQLANGFSLSQVRRLDQAMDLLEELKGTYLTEQDIASLVGHAVNARRTAQLVQEEYEQLGNAT